MIVIYSAIKQIKTKESIQIEIADSAKVPTKWDISW